MGELNSRMRSFTCDATTQSHARCHCVVCATSRLASLLHFSLLYTDFAFCLPIKPSSDAIFWQSSLFSRWRTVWHHQPRLQLSHSTLVPSSIARESRAFPFPHCSAATNKELLPLLTHNKTLPSAQHPAAATFYLPPPTFPLRQDASVDSVLHLPQPHPQPITEHPSCLAGTRLRPVSVNNV